MCLRFGTVVRVLIAHSTCRDLKDAEGKAGYTVSEQVGALPLSLPAGFQRFRHISALFPLWAVCVTSLHNYLGTCFCPWPQEASEQGRTVKKRWASENLTVMKDCDSICYVPQVSSVGGTLCRCVNARAAWASFNLLQPKQCAEQGP